MGELEDRNCGWRVGIRIRVGIESCEVTVEGKWGWVDGGVGWRLVAGVDIQCGLILDS